MVNLPKHLQEKLAAKKKAQEEAKPLKSESKEISSADSSTETQTKEQEPTQEQMQEAITLEIMKLRDNGYRAYQNLLVMNSIDQKIEALNQTIIKLDQTTQTLGKMLEASLSGDSSEDENDVEEDVGDEKEQ